MCKTFLFSKPNHFVIACVKVNEEGDYNQIGHSQKLAYSSMTYLRATLIFTSGNYLSQAVTIAVRYSAVRRQGLIETE